MKTLSAMVAMLLLLTTQLLSQQLPHNETMCNLISTGKREYLRILPPPAIQQKLKALALAREAAQKSGNKTAMAAYNPFSINFIGDWSAEAKNALQYACDIWSFIIDLPLSIKVDAHWVVKDDPNILASCRATDFVQLGTYRYPISLAEAMKDSNMNGVTAEMSMDANSTATWYFGTDGNCGTSQTDFVSVAMHEICHGLGFSGSMNWAAGGTAYGDADYENPPRIYDYYARTIGADVPLISLPRHGSDLAYAITHGVNFYSVDESIGRMVDGMEYGSAQLYTPTTWAQGSSYSHLDEVFNDTKADLMTYAIGHDHVIHDPGNLIRGMMVDMGWKTFGSTTCNAFTGIVAPGTDPWGLRFLPGYQGYWPTTLHFVAPASGTASWQITH